MFANNREVVAALYLAYFDRPAEPKGLDYWTGQLDSGASAFDISANFSSTREARDIYPDLRNDDVGNINSFLYRSFNNIFDRSPTAGDNAYWYPTIDNGKPASQVLVELILSARGIDATKLQNTIDVSLYFTEQSRESSKPFDIDASREFINEIGFGQDGVDRAQNTIDVYFRPPLYQPSGPSAPVSTLLDTFDGATAKYDFYFGTTETAGGFVYSGPSQAVGGPGVDFSGIPGDGTIDLSGTTITVEWANGTTFSPNGFNGIRLFDVNDEMEDVVGLTIIQSNLAGFAADDLTYDANNIWIDFESTAPDSNSVVVIGVTFA